MRFLATWTFVFLAASGHLAASSLLGSDVTGTYVEARNADVYTGACFANSEAGLVGDLAVLGWQIEKGVWKGVRLDGLAVAGVVRASDTLGYVSGNPYPAKAVLIIDARADAEQRLALKSFAQHMAGDLLSDVVRIDYRPVRLEIAGGNVHHAKATLIAGELARIQTRAMSEGDNICSHEEVWYRPLSRLHHAMPAYTLANSFQGEGLGARWHSPGQRSAFVGEFHYHD
jgi:hypothetical protein